MIEGEMIGFVGEMLGLHFEFLVGELVVDEFFFIL